MTALWERLQPPEAVARLQRTYDRWSLVRRMYDELGFTFAAIGLRLDLSRGRVNEIYRNGYYAQRFRQRSPVEIWLASWERRSWKALTEQAWAEEDAEIELAARLKHKPLPTPVELAARKEAQRQTGRRIAEESKQRRLGARLVAHDYFDQVTGYWVRIHWQADGIKR